MRTDALSTVGIDQLFSRNKRKAVNYKLVKMRMNFHISSQHLQFPSISTVHRDFLITAPQKLSYLLTYLLCLCAVWKRLCTEQRSKPSCHRGYPSTNEQLTTEGNFQSSHHQRIMMTVSKRFRFHFIYRQPWRATPPTKLNTTANILTATAAVLYLRSNDTRPV